MAIDLDNILNYINPEPRYAGELKNLGLIGKDDLKEARNQSIFQGLLGAGLGYLAQPQNKGYGTITPYLAKAGMQGLQFMKAPYEQLTQDALMKDKLMKLGIKEIKGLKRIRKKKQFKIFYLMDCTQKQLLADKKKHTILSLKK